MVLKTDTNFSGLTPASITTVASQSPENIGGTMMQYPMNAFGAINTTGWFTPKSTVYRAHKYGEATFWVSSAGTTTHNKYIFSRLLAQATTGLGSQCFVIPNIPNAAASRVMRAGMGDPLATTENIKSFTVNPSGTMYKFKHQVGNYNGSIRTRLEYYDELRSSWMVVDDKVFSSLDIAQQQPGASGFGYIGIAAGNLTAGNLVNIDTYDFQEIQPVFAAEHLANYIGLGQAQVLQFTGGTWQNEITLADFYNNINTIQTVAGTHNFGAATHKLRYTTLGVETNKITFSAPQQLYLPTNYNPKVTAAIRIPQAGIAANVIKRLFVHYRLAAPNGSFLGYSCRVTVKTDNTLLLELTRDTAPNVSTVLASATLGTWANGNWIYPQIEIKQDAISLTNKITVRVAINATAWSGAQYLTHASLTDVSDSVLLAETNRSYFANLQLFTATAGDIEEIGAIRTEAI